nr:MAG TPA: hypothetical protein [Caudoviricetes sp.]
MKNIFEKIATFFKEYWNVYAPIIISTIFSWFTNWNANQMQILNQYFGTIITLCCMFTMLKFMFFPNKEKKGVEKLVSMQNSVKNMEMTTNVEEKVDETILLIQTSVKGGKKIMQKIKNFFKWCWTYKEQIIGLTGSLIYTIFVAYVYINDKFGWIFEIVPNTDFWFWAVRVGFGVLSAIFVFFGMRNQCIWGGVGSRERAEEYLANLSAKITSDTTLSTKAQKKISEALKTMNKTLKEANSLLEKYKASYNKVVDDINVFKELIDNQLEYDNDAYQSALTNASDLSNKISEIQATIDNLTTKIEHYNQVMHVNK